MCGKRKIHYAWKILMVCCLLQGATLGLVQNSRGLFFAPVSESICCTVTQFTAQQIFFSVANIITLPFVDRILRRNQMPWILCVIMTIFSGATVLMGTFKSVYQWYVAAVIQGAASSFLILIPTALLIEQWFEEYRGLAMGVSAMSAGLTGVVTNLFMSDFVMNHWRIGYFILGGIAFVITVPAMAVVVEFSPETKGMRPYGKKKQDERIVLKKAEYTPSFVMINVLLFFCASAVAVASAFLQHFPNYAISVGAAVSVGAMMTSLAMIGNTIGKLFMGVLTDRYEVWKVSFIGLSLIAISFLLLFMSNNRIVIYFAALMNGLTLAFSTVMMPLLFSEFYEEVQYGKALSRMMIFTNLSSALGANGISVICDISGTYQGAFGAGFLLVIISIGLLLLVMKKNPNYSVNSGKNNGQ